MPHSPATAKGFSQGYTPANKRRRYPAEAPAPDEVRDLLKAPFSRAPTGIPNRVLIVVIYRGGLRLGEALALKPKDVIDTMRARERER